MRSTHCTTFYRASEVASIGRAGGIGAAASIGRADSHTADAPNKSCRWYRNRRINRAGSTAAAASIGLIGSSAAAEVLFLHENLFELFLIEHESLLKMHQ